MVIMRKALAVVAPILVCVACLQAQSASPKFNGARAFEDLRQLVAIGPRVAGTPGAQAARDYIRKELQAIGVAVEEQPFEATTPNGRVKMVNVRATFAASPGGASKQRLVIGGHYDTKLFKE